MRRIFILLGPPGCGKGTLARSLVKSNPDFGWLSSGELLRNSKKTDSELGRRIGDLIDAGQFVPDELIIDLITPKLQAIPPDSCLLLDGFPRTLPQARWLSEWTEGEENLEVAGVFDLQADERVLEARILKRAKEKGREDDTLSTFRERMEIFRRRTEPLIEYYTAAEKLSAIDASRQPDEVESQAMLLIQQTLPTDHQSAPNTAG